MLIGLIAACSFDQVPPTLTVPPLDTPRAGEISLPLLVEDADPGIGAIELGGPAAMAATVDMDRILIDTTLLPDGPTTLTVRAVDSSWYRNAVQVELAMVIDNTPAEVMLTSRGGGRGRTLAIFTHANEPISMVFGRGLGAETAGRVLEPSVGRWLTGVDLEAELSPMPVVIRVVDRAGNVTQMHTSVEVTDVVYPTGGLITLTDAQRRAREDDTARQQAMADRQAAYAQDIGEARWSGPFEMPTRGRRTSPFGKFRSYSDGKKQLHTGLDVAAGTGTRVGAAEAGEVVLAEEQAIYGNVVIVHHGEGVTTSYNHLSEIAVSVGDVVEKGDRLGAVGSTGQSTGPHLHWGLVVAGVPVNPDEWLADGFMQP
ncbi:MAG: murein DD-endopeptidase MepM/ murein hydrolase activator NlpD [Myxococcota bacterium]|jgi:murein DD-endopeptidase MepM/ murein hydrolase activator NlpD